MQTHSREKNKKPTPKSKSQNVAAKVLRLQAEIVQVLSAVDRNRVCARFSAHVRWSKRAAPRVQLIRQQRFESQEEGRNISKRNKKRGQRAGLNQQSAEDKIPQNDDRREEGGGPEGPRERGGAHRHRRRLDSEQPVDQREPRKVAPAICPQAHRRVNEDREGRGRDDAARQKVDEELADEILERAVAVVSPFEVEEAALGDDPVDGGEGEEGGDEEHVGH